MGRWATPRGNAALDRVEEVYDASYRRLVGQLTGVTGDAVEAEDAVMEAFARAVTHSRAFLDADNPEAWLRTVAVNVTRTRLARSRTARRSSLSTPSSLAHAPTAAVAVRRSRRGWRPPSWSRALGSRWVSAPEATPHPHRPAPPGPTSPSIRASSPGPCATATT